MVPVDEQGNAYFVRQYRAPIERVLLEIPAGKLDAPDEDRLLAAKRELTEETGLTAERWDHLADVVTTPGFSSEKISLYLARDLVKGASSPDEDEFLNVEKIPLSRFAARFSQEKFRMPRRSAPCCSPGSESTRRNEAVWHILKG